MRRVLFAAAATLAIAPALPLAEPGALPGQARVAAQNVAPEYHVKAAYLYNFVKYVEWPAPGNTGPVNICVAGRNPFGNVLADTIKGEQIEGRPLTQRVILEPEDGCHVIFIPEGAATSAYLRAARGVPTLTVGETDDFLEQGGIIQFVSVANNIRFAINTAAAEQARLQVSSRLLRLAVNTSRDAR
jgi:hypothetical protein